MMNAIIKTLGWQLDDLSRSLQEGYYKESPDSNFAHYVFYQSNSQIPFTVATDIDIGTLEPNRLNQAPTIAAVGYGLACGRQFSGSFLEIWVNGLTRLSGRDAFPSDRASFFYQPTVLLGIVLGVSHYYDNQTEKLEWLQKILVEGERRLIHNDLWTFWLSAYAASILSVNWKSRNLPSVSEMTLEELALAKWLCTVDSNLSSRIGLNQLESAINKALFENCVEFAVSTHSSSHAALLYFALKTTIHQIIQLYWNDFEEIHYNPQTAIEWLSNTCNNIHTVTQHLQSHFSKGFTSETLNIRTMEALMELLPRLRSDADLMETEIRRQIKMRSRLFVNGNQVVVNTGDNVTMTSNQESNNVTNINASNANIGFINSGSGTVSNFSQTIGQNIDEITRLVNSLREMAQQFPEAQRQETLVTLDDLQEDIDNPDKQKPERIKIRLGRLAVIAGTIAGLVAGAADFSNNVLELHEKLGFPVPIELNHPQLNHQLPLDTGEQILQSFIAAGRIIPPAHHPDIPSISETDLKAMVSDIQISGKPLSETIIEERGEW